MKKNTIQKNIRGKLSGVGELSEDSKAIQYIKLFFKWENGESNFFKIPRGQYPDLLDRLIEEDSKNIIFVGERTSYLERLGVYSKYRPTRRAYKGVFKLEGREYSVSYTEELNYQFEAVSTSFEIRKNST